MSPVGNGSSSPHFAAALVLTPGSGNWRGRTTHCPSVRAADRRKADPHDRAIYQWAFASLTASPGAGTFYDRHRAADDTHHAALRALGNCWVGILHGCLTHHTSYDEQIAWVSPGNDRCRPLTTGPYPTRIAGG